MKKDDEIYLRAKRNKSLTAERSKIGKLNRPKFLVQKRIKNSINEKYLYKKWYGTENLNDQKTAISLENKDY